MARPIIAMSEAHRVAALDLVEAVFTAHENTQESRPGGLAGIRGQVSYQDYETLR